MSSSSDPANSPTHPENIENPQQNIEQHTPRSGYNSGSSSSSYQAPRQSEDGSGSSSSFDPDDYLQGTYGKMDDDCIDYCNMLDTMSEDEPWESFDINKQLGVSPDRPRSPKPPRTPDPDYSSSENPQRSPGRDYSLLENEEGLAQWTSPLHWPPQGGAIPKMKQREVGLLDPTPSPTQRPYKSPYRDTSGEYGAAISAYPGYPSHRSPGSDPQPLSPFNPNVWDDLANAHRLWRYSEPSPGDPRLARESIEKIYALTVDLDSRMRGIRLCGDQRRQPAVMRQLRQSIDDFEQIMELFRDGMTSGLNARIYTIAQVAASALTQATSREDRSIATLARIASKLVMATRRIIIYVERWKNKNQEERESTGPSKFMQQLKAARDEEVSPPTEHFQRMRLSPRYDLRQQIPPQGQGPQQHMPPQGQEPQQHIPPQGQEPQQQTSPQKRGSQHQTSPNTQRRSPQI